MRAGAGRLRGRERRSLGSYELSDEEKDVEAFRHSIHISSEHWVLGTIQGPVGWFEPRPDLAEQMEEMERRVHGWRPRPRRKHGR